MGSKGTSKVVEGERRYVTREEILGAADIVVEEVETPEWGGWVRVRGLTGRERDAFENEVTQRNGKDVRVNARNIRARLVMLSVVDERGKRLFTSQDVEALGEKSAKALDRVFSAAMTLSGLRDEDVQELAENLGDGQGDDSSFV